MEVVVARVGRAHGVRGEAVVEVRTDEPDRRLRVGQPLRCDGDSHVLVPRSVRRHGQRWLMAFEGVPDRTTVEGLRGTLLVMDVADDDRPEDPEEYYDRQLVGLMVRTVDADGVAVPGRDVGAVREVLHLPAQDVLAVGSGAAEVLVPFVSELVPVVDLAAGWLGVRDRPGLLREDPGAPDDDEQPDQPDRQGS